MIQVMDELLRQNMNNMLKKFVQSSLQINVWQCRKYRMKLAFRKPRITRFWLQSSVFNVQQQNLCHICWITSKSWNHSRKFDCGNND